MTRKRNIEAERVEKWNRDLFQCREIELDNLPRLRIRFGDRTVNSIKLLKTNQRIQVEKGMKGSNCLEWILFPKNYLVLKRRASKLVQYDVGGRKLAINHESENGLKINR